MINFEDFKKVQIQIGTVLSAEKVPDTDKLLRLQVDFGDEKRQIVSGIAESYPEASVLVGQQFPFITNLEPRTIRGVLSQGMIMATVDGEGLALLSPTRKVESGSEVR